MNKKILFFVIAFLLSIGVAKAQVTDFTTQVLKTCISMPEFQESYSVAKNSTIKQVYILQHGVSFDEKNVEKIEDYNVILINKALV